MGWFNLKEIVIGYGIVFEDTDIVLKLCDIESSYKKTFFKNIQRYINKPIPLQKAIDTKIIDNLNWKYLKEENIIRAFIFTIDENVNNGVLWFDASHLKFDEELSKVTCVLCGIKTKERQYPRGSDFICRDCWCLEQISELKASISNKTELIQIYQNEYDIFLMKNNKN